MGDNSSVVKVSDPTTNSQFGGSFTTPSIRLLTVRGRAVLGLPVHMKDTISPVRTAGGEGFCLFFISALVESPKAGIGVAHLTQSSRTGVSRNALNRTNSVAALECHTIHPAEPETGKFRIGMTSWIIPPLVLIES